MARDHTPEDRKVIRENPRKSVANSLSENRTARKLAPAGRPVDCLGLTKRWSLYVASTATPGFVISTILTDLRQAESILYSPVVCGL